MTTLKNSLRKLALYDILSKECMGILNLSINDEGCVVNNINGDIMEWHDLETIELFNPIPYEDDRIDGILFFGDGTIEFHLEKECDAINFADFSNDYIKMIIEELKNKQCSKFV